MLDIINNITRITFKTDRLKMKNGTLSNYFYIHAKYNKLHDFFVLPSYPFLGTS